MPFIEKRNYVNLIAASEQLRIRKVKKVWP